MSFDPIEVAVIGAGPYGLSVAAHLRARGVGFRIFGHPMSFWLRMPSSLNLKSYGFATNVYVPHADYDFPGYCRTRGLEPFDPCTMKSFAEYGLWVQERLVPEVEQVRVERVGSARDHFDLTLSSGETLSARQVVVAVGLSYFARMPEALGGLPQELASHTADHIDYDRFKGKEVAVVGAGASAVEAAALLHEAGAGVQLLVRGEPPFFFDRIKPHRSLLERLRVPNSALGQSQFSWLLEHVPFGPHFLPEERRVRLLNSYLGPSAPWWIRKRFEGNVPVHAHCSIEHAEPSGPRVRLRLRDGQGGERVVAVDHVVAGTGYDPSADRMTFLDEELRARIERTERAPRLSRHFESSVSGLFFVGPASALSFGPLFRFVAGAKYAAPTVAARSAHLAAWARVRRAGLQAIFAASPLRS
ncbi:MAG: NAD(P)-binding domain-containing protein [Polyangiaceae bacterium]|jgi:thioredoxin reductase